MTKKVVRPCGSIWINYIEANKSLAQKHFIMRIKMSAAKKPKKAGTGCAY
jgi:hypothetical protein